MYIFKKLSVGFPVKLRTPQLHTYIIYIYIYMYFKNLRARNPNEVAPSFLNHLKPSLFGLKQSFKSPTGLEWEPH